MVIISEEEKNPTEYFFNTSLDSVRSAMYDGFANRKYCCYSFGDSSSHFFKKAEHEQRTQTDLVLSLDDWFNPYCGTCLSQVYYKNDIEPYLYICTFLIHLEDFDNGVKVKIYAINPKIYVGKMFLRNIAFHSRGPRFKEVPSTSVEEYEILQIIGKGLGIEIPEIKIPQKVIISPRREKIGEYFKWQQVVMYQIGS
jgi:thiol-disulfide isomerase/thioredoxin